jgi:hypothetical protein
MKQETLFLNEFTALGVARAAQNITGQSYSLIIPYPYVAGWNAYADLVHGEFLMDQINFNYRVDYTSALLQSYAAVGSSWEYGFIPVQGIVYVPVPDVCVKWGVVVYPCVNYVPVVMYSYGINVPSFPDIPLGWFPHPLPNITIDITSERLAHYGTRYGQEIFALLHEYVHGQESAIPNETFLNIISSAPCAGPRHMPTNNDNDLGVDGWRGTNRFNRPLNADGWIDKDTVYSRGEFNGMDYMLLHNLYTLSRGGVTEPFKNRLNQVSSETLTTPGNHWSYETIEFNGTIQANAATTASPVELSAGKSITLKPGFHSQPGSTMRVYTSDYNACNTSPQQSSALRKDESKVQQLPVDTLAIQEAINKSLQAKISNRINTEVANASQNLAYTPLSTYLENRTREAQMQSESENEVSLFPNPTTNKLNLALKLEKNQMVRIRLRDINGKDLMTLFDGAMKTGLNELSINVGALQPGTFLIETQGEFFSDYQKLVKTAE